MPTETTGVLRRMAVGGIVAAVGAAAFPRSRTQLALEKEAPVSRDVAPQLLAE